MWFFPKTVRQIPREKRVEWLKFIFEDGFDSFCRMMKSGSFPQRVAAFHVRLFVKCPALRCYVELFFRYYFKMAHMNRTETTERLCTPVRKQPND